MTAVLFSDPDAEADKVIGDCVRLENPRSFFLFAGAGSGKTGSLVTVLRAIQKNQRDTLMSRGQRVAVITYTNAASQVISQRLEFDPLIHVSTIHSFAWSLIGGYNRDIKNWLQAKLQADISELEQTLATTRGGTKVRLDRESRLIEKRSRLAKLDKVKLFNYSPTGENTGRDSLSHFEVIELCGAFLNKTTLQSILVGRFPLLLIDESQDTNKTLIDSLFAVEAANHGRFCLGLFGDMMQRIYFDGKVGLEKMIPPAWARPEKKMNWRCPKRVVRLINEIRRPFDDRKQEAPPYKPEGFARCFVFPSTVQGKPEIEAAVTQEMARITNDENWRVPEQCKVLTLEHHMAARRLGFGEFFLPLYQINEFRTGLLEGTLSGVPLLLESILPLALAVQRGDKFEIARIVRTRSPLLKRKLLVEAGEQRVALIEKARLAVSKLTDVLQQPNPTIMSALLAVASCDLFEIPEILRATMRAMEAGLDSAQDDPNVTTEGAVVAWYEALKAPFDQLRLTAEYLSDTAKFDTHHGVKGREFPRVMVVMDDEEARGFSFSFDKLFEVVPRSDSDMRREAKGEETSSDQTRRLFYVTCSRAERSLALVLYSQNPSLARRFLLEKNWFGEDEIALSQ